MIKVNIMFNTPFDQQTADLKLLNFKLRGHQGGRLNSTPVTLGYSERNNADEMSATFRNWMVVILALSLYFLIRNAFAK